MAARDREGSDPRRARRERRRAVGPPGRPHGRHRAAAHPDAAPLPGHRGRARGRRARPSHAGRHRPRGLHLPAARAERRPARRLRDEPQALARRRPRLGLRHGADPGGGRPDRARAVDRIRALPRAAAGRHQAVGQRRHHLHSGRQPACRPRPRTPQLLVRVRGDGRLLPGRRHRAGTGQLDRRRRSRRRRLRHGHHPVRSVRHRRLLPARDDGAVLRASLPHRVPERRAAGGASAQDVARLPRPAGRRCALQRRLRPRGRPVLRPRRRLRGEPHLAPVQRAPDRRRGGCRDPFGGGAVRDDGLRPLRGHRTRRRGVARPRDGLRLARGRTHQARADAEPSRPSDGRPHGQPTRRRPLLGHRLVLPAGVAPALVRRAPPGRRQRADHQPLRRLVRVLPLRPEVARDPAAAGRHRPRATRRSRSCRSERRRSPEPTLSSVASRSPASSATRSPSRRRSSARCSRRCAMRANRSACD